MSSNNRKLLFSIFGIFITFGLVLFSINFFSSFNRKISDIDVSIKELEKNILGTTTANTSDMSVETKVFKLDETNRSNIVVTYKVTVTNLSQYRIYDLLLKNNLNQYFGQYNYVVDKVESNSLTLNSNFNGSTNINLNNGKDELNASESKVIFVTIAFDPQGALGPFENYVTANGIVDGPETVDTGNTDGGTSDGTTDITEDPTTTGGNGNSDSGSDSDYTPPAPDLTPREVTFRLWDAYNDILIRELQPNDIIDLSTLTTPFITVDIVVSPRSTESALFSLNGNSEYQRESFYPLSLSGDDYGDYYPWNFEIGVQNLGVTIFAEMFQQGEIVGEDSISFTIVGEFSAELQELRERLLLEWGNDYLTNESGGDSFRLQELQPDPPLPIFDNEVIPDPVVIPIDEETQPEETITEEGEPIKEDEGNVLGDETGGILAETGSNLILGFLLGIVTLSLVILLYKVSNKNSKFI